MGSASYFPKRVKRWVEVRLISEANVPCVSPLTKPIKLNFDLCPEINRNPAVMLGMSDREVKRRTGLRSETALLTFALIAYNGDIDKLSTSSSKLTWCEEWFLYFKIG